MVESFSGRAPYALHVSGVSLLWQREMVEEVLYVSC